MVRTPRVDKAQPTVYHRPIDPGQLRSLSPRLPEHDHLSGERENAALDNLKSLATPPNAHPLGQSPLVASRMKVLAASVAAVAQSAGDHGSAAMPALAPLQHNPQFPATDEDRRLQQDQDQPRDHDQDQDKNNELNDATLPIAPQFRQLPIRPYSGVGETPPQTTLPFFHLSPRQIVLAATDIDKIQNWFVKLEREQHQFSSYALFCEMVFRESEVLQAGKRIPNRVTTACALHCLYRAKGLFVRHENILEKLVDDLGASIYIDWKGVPVNENHALTDIANGLAYYESDDQLQAQVELLQNELHKQKHSFQLKLDALRLRLQQMEQLETIVEIHKLEKLAFRKTSLQELLDKLLVVLKRFSNVTPYEKQQIIRCVLEVMKTPIGSDLIALLVQHMDKKEKDRMIREVFQEELKDLVERTRGDSYKATANRHFSEIEAVFLKFQNLLSEVLRPGNSTRIHEADISEYERRLLENVQNLVEEHEQLKCLHRELESKSKQHETQLNELRFRSNAQLNEYQQNAEAQMKRLAEVQGELDTIRAKYQEIKDRMTHEKATQTLGDDDVHGRGSGLRRRRNRRNNNFSCSSSSFGDDETDNLGEDTGGRKRDKNVMGIVSIIENSRIPQANIRRILMKRKPLTLNELHSIIVGYYQAKMYQDIQDDNNGRMRSDLGQCIMDMYMLHYGLKELAVSQLVFLDGSVRRFAHDSARVRLFGMLAGCLEPNSRACSVQAIDFFLFVLVVLFNAGVYKKGRKQVVTIAQSLREKFGEPDPGIQRTNSTGPSSSTRAISSSTLVNGSSSSTTASNPGTASSNPGSVQLRCDVVIQTIQLVFSFAPTEQDANLEILRKEIIQFSSASASAASALTTDVATATIDLDIALEKIMLHWFVLHEQQVQDIFSMFDTVDKNGDGTLDFNEFWDIVRVFESSISRRDALQLYNRVAGDDNVIDQNEFVNAMLIHQRAIILKELYANENAQQQSGSSRALTPSNSSKTKVAFDFKSRRKITFSESSLRRDKEQQALLNAAAAENVDASAALQQAPTPSPPRPRLGTFNHEDDNSYASLTEAMNETTKEFMESLDIAGQGMDDDADEAPPPPQKPTSPRAASNRRLLGNNTAKMAVTAEAAHDVGGSEDSDDADDVQQAATNISFSSLARLSSWANMAKTSVRKPIVEENEVVEPSTATQAQAQVQMQVTSGGGDEVGPIKKADPGQEATVVQEFVTPKVDDIVSNGNDVEDFQQRIEQLFSHALTKADLKEEDFASVPSTLAMLSRSGSSSLVSEEELAAIFNQSKAPVAGAAGTPRKATRK